MRRVSLLPPPPHHAFNLSPSSGRVRSPVESTRLSTGSCLTSWYRGWNRAPPHPLTPSASAKISTLLTCSIFIDENQIFLLCLPRSYPCGNNCRPIQLMRPQRIHNVCSINASQQLNPPHRSSSCVGESSAYVYPNPTPLPSLVVNCLFRVTMTNGFRQSEP